MAPQQETVGPLLDAIGDPLIVVEDGRVTAANRAASRLFGPPLQVEPLDMLIPVEIPEPEGDEPASVAVTGLGGPRRQWEIRVSRLDGDRRLLHLLDRTMIASAERMRVDFAANASHELSTPIAAITGFAETLADDSAGGDRETRHRFLAIISREARRMQRLIEDLMNLSRIEADRHVAPQTVIDLAPLVREAAQAAAEQRQPRGADLSMGQIASVAIRGDAGQLQQVAHNLVSNSFKYGRPGTPVTVTLTADVDHAVLEVSDHGDGIAAEHLPQVTQRFYRVDTRRSRAVGGTGLGLAIVKHIVERHGGRLDIISDIGVGTRVRVLLPLAAAPSHDRNEIVTGSK